MPSAAYMTQVAQFCQVRACCTMNVLVRCGVTGGFCTTTDINPLLQLHCTSTRTREHEPTDVNSLSQTST